MGRGTKHSRKRSDSSSRSPSPKPKANQESSSSNSRIMSELRNLADSINTQGNNLSNQVQGISSKIDAMDSRIAGVESGLNSCKSTLDKHELEIQQILAQLQQHNVSRETLENKAKKIEQRLATAESSQPQPLDDSFDRAPNPTLIKTNSKALIAKEALESEFAILAAKSNLAPDSFKIMGPPVAQYFTIQFLGTPNLAAARANMVLRSLKQDDGTWSRFLVKDPQDMQVPVFLGPDKSPKQIRTEVLAKRLATVLEGFKLEDLHVNRRRGQVSYKWRPLCMVHIESRDKPELLWDAAYAKEIKLDTQAVYNSFKTVSAQNTASSPISWEKLTSS